MKKIFMESLIPPFDAYKGESPYIFVSYAHKNSDIVFAHITRLHNEGFRIWYDEGIDPGTDWSDEIADALVDAEVFLVFLSDAAANSHNVRKEIVFAIDQKKYMICVYVEETELPSGLKMQLGNIQALIENRFHNKEKFYDRLFNSLLPEQTQGAERVDLPVNKITAKKKSVSFLAKYKKGIIGLSLAIILLIAIAGGVFMLQKPDKHMVFADKNLELALREELQKPHGAITPEDLATFNGRLDLSGRQITDITPLQYMAEITMLNLENNQISDISPLSALPGLMVIGLGNNQISNVAPLQSLSKSLIALSLTDNPLQDLKQLRPLSNLEVLDLSNVPITDLELGKYLRKLKSLLANGSRHGLDAEAMHRFKANLPPNCKIEHDATANNETE